MSSILVTGGTGFLGQKLVPALLAAGHQVTVMSRHPEKAMQQYDGAVDAVASLDALTHEVEVIINLAGESINQGRWTSEQKQRLRQSRLDITTDLAAFCQKHPPKQVVQASAVGYYGQQIKGPWPVFLENGPKGSGFLADLCAEWEAAALTMASGSHLSRLRFAPIFDKDGGAFPLIRKPYLYHAGARIGSGLQPFPWVHREDVVGAILHVLQLGDEAAAIYNVAAPELIRQKESVRIIHNYLGGLRPTLWVPKKAFQLAMGEKAELAIGGQFAYPKALRDDGYVFRYPTLAEALPTLMP